MDTFWPDQPMVNHLKSARSSAHESRPGFVWAGVSKGHLLILRDSSPAPIFRISPCLPWADPGAARTGPVLESNGLVAFVRINPRSAHSTRTSSAWDQTSLAIWKILVEAVQ